MDPRFARKSRGPESQPLTRSVASCVAISLGLHALVIAALLYVRVDFAKPRLPPGAISVNLVSLPGPGPAPGPVAGDGGPPAEKPMPVEAPKPAPEKPAVSVAEPKPELFRPVSAAAPIDDLRVETGPEPAVEAPPVEAPPAVEEPAPANTTSRLLEAKRRAQKRRSGGQ